MAESPAPAFKSQRARTLRRVAWVGVIVGVLALVLGAFIYFEARRKPGVHAGQAGPGGPAGPVEVRVVELRAQTVALAPRFLGRTEASQTVEIRTRVSGFLDARHFEEGTTVQTGQPLFQIDPRPFEAEVAIAQAQLEIARAQLNQAQNQLDRVQTAVSRGGGTPIELEQAETDQRVAEANVHLADARLAQAKLDFGYTHIVSPITGMIGRSERDVGSYVQAGLEGLLATVQQVDPIDVLYSVSEQDLLRWQRLIDSSEVVLPESGRIALSLTLIDGSHFPHPGSLDFLDIKVDSTTGTALARGVFPNPDLTLRPGQSVRVTAEGITRPNTLIVPKQAVLLSPTAASVYVVDPDNTIQLRTVQLGDWHESGWVIEQGLRAGERVVIDKLMGLRPGASVVPVAASATAPAAPRSTGTAAPPAQPAAEPDR